MSYFALFSTESGASLDPKKLATVPNTLIVFANDILDDDYTQPKTFRRGSVTPTIGGNAIQEFDAVMSDQVIRIGGQVATGSWIDDTTAQALSTAYANKTQLYFSDGYNCYQVRWLPGEDYAPELHLSLSWFHSHGQKVWSWSLLLGVVSHDIDDGPTGPGVDP